MSGNQFQPFNQFPGQQEPVYAEVLPSNRRRWPWIVVVLGLIGVCGIGAALYFLAFRKSVDDHIRDSVTYRDKGQIDEAVRSANRAVKRDPNSLRAVHHRAWIYFAARNYQASMQDAQKTYDAGFEIERSAYLIRESLFRLKRFDEAIQKFEERFKRGNWRSQLDELNNNNTLAWYYAVANRDLDRALTLVNRSLKMAESIRGSPIVESSLAAALDTRGYIYYLQGKYKLAFADVDEALRQVGKDYLQGLSRGTKLEPLKKSLAIQFYHRSLVYDRLGKSSEAKSDRDKVVELGFQPNESLHF